MVLLLGNSAVMGLQQHLNEIYLCNLGGNFSLASILDKACAAEQPYHYLVFLPMVYSFVSRFAFLIREPRLQMVRTVGPNARTV